MVLTYINSLEGRVQYNALENLKEYIYYLEDKDLITDEHYDVLESLMSIKLGKRKDKRRKLPNESDILTFDYYLKYFFKDEEIEDDMKVMFYPVLIWWKVTNVIPMRPVELCTRLKRDCLEEVDGKYYLHVDRAKVDVGKNKTVGRKQRIPLLNKLSITKDIFDLINEYIKLTFDNFIQSELATILARGDARMCEAICKAVELGANFDFLENSFNYDAWRVALNEANIDTKAMLEEISVHSVLPWDNIVTSVSKEELAGRYINIMKGNEYESSSDK